MRRRIILFALSMLLVTGCLAQSGAVKKSADAVFTLTTFNKDGSILSTSNGVFVDAEGTAVSPWRPFVGAASAVVIDAKGNRHDVDAVIGANGIYDVVKFRIKDKSSSSLVSVPSAAASGQQAWIVPNKKSSAPKAAKINGVETFMDKYSYYIVDADADNMLDGCPVVNDKGQLLGILNASTASLSVTDIKFASDFTSTGIAVTDATLKQTGIRLALPKDEKQAQIALVFASDSGDNAKYMATVDEFISLFPKLNDGYYASAVNSVNNKDYNAAEKTMQTALKMAENTAETHYNYARVILLAKADALENETLPDTWTYDKAIAETQEANRISEQFQYHYLEGQLLSAKGEYQQAYDKFMELTKGEYKNGDLYYQAMLARAQAGAEDSELLSLLDSAVAACDTPYTSIAAPVFIARAVQNDKMGNYRNAMKDFYQYEALMYQQLGADFYYIREQSEVRGKFYQPALNDIAHAVMLDPKNELYWTELASLNLRLKKYDEAILASNQCIALNEDNSDAYLILGISQVETGKKKEGVENINKSKALGNEQADKFIEKYK